MPSKAHVLACLALLAAAPLAAQEPSYALRPGDRITAEVFTAAGERVDVVSGSRIIDRNGDVFLPFVGSVHVAGLDETSLRRLLVDRYEPYYADPVVDVEVELRVSVTGSVGQPGQLYLDPTATLVDAIAQAGGMASEIAVATIQIPANQSEVRLVRDGVTTILNLRPDEVTEEVLRMRIKSGDWLHVPPRDRSRIRDEIQFWGGVLSFVGSLAALVVLIAR